MGVGTPHEIANYIWACGKLELAGAQNLFRMFDERAEWLMGKRNPQDIAYCV
jgi:hypothetical protein